MAMHNLDPLPEDDVAEDGEKGEDSGHSRFAIDYQERDVVHFQTIRQVSYPSTIFIGMSDNDDFVPSIYKLSRELIYMAFDSSCLREEEVANHCNIVRHCDVFSLIIVKTGYVVPHPSQMFSRHQKLSGSPVASGFVCYYHARSFFDYWTIDKLKYHSG